MICSLSGTSGVISVTSPERFFGRRQVAATFPLTITVEGRLARRITTTLGAGGAPVRVVTTNGPVSIRRN